MKYFFTVGPAQLHPQLQLFLKDAVHQNIGSISHRSETFRNIYKHTDTHLRKLMNIPASHSIFFMPSATEIWERMIANTVQKKSAHFINGDFSKKFYEASIALGKQTQTFVLPDGQGFSKLDNYNIDADVELICITQNETSTGASMSTSDIVKLKKKYPNILLCADIVSSAPYPNLDFKYLDCAFFSVQKAFGLPAGLGIWIVNNACIAKSKTIKNKGAHHTLPVFEKNYKTFETPSTPNVLNIYLLSQVAASMNSEGIKNIRNIIETRAKILYDIPKNNNNFSCNVIDKKNQSQTVIVLNTTLNAKEVIRQLAEKNIIVSSGYGAYKPTQIRIGNFPAVSNKAFEKLVKALKEI
jgi:phosphoserine aminotransferase